MASDSDSTVDGHALNGRPGVAGGVRLPACAHSLLFIGILRRRFAHPLDDARVGDGRDGLLDPLDLNLMIPVVAEVEPVAEDTIRLQIQVVQLCRARVSIPFLSSLRTSELRSWARPDRTDVCRTETRTDVRPNGRTP